MLISQSRPQVVSFIEEHRCSGDYHKRWNCPLHATVIAALQPGVHIKGNLETLGWAVMKGFTISASQRVDYSNKMKVLKRDFKSNGKNKNVKRKCVCIQSQGNEKTNMQFDSLVNHVFDEEVFANDSNDQPQRMMYYQLKSGHGKKMAKDNPMLFEIFQQNLALCIDYVRYETSIRSDFVFSGHNIIANYKGIREQYLHTDYAK